MRSVGLVLIACLAIVLAACSGDTSSSTPGASASTSASETDAPTGDGPPGCLEAQLAFDEATDRLLLLNCVEQDGTGSNTEQVWSWDVHPQFVVRAFEVRYSLGTVFELLVFSFHVVVWLVVANQ